MRRGLKGELGEVVGGELFFERVEGAIEQLAEVSKEARHGGTREKGETGLGDEDRSEGGGVGRPCPSPEG